MSNTLTANNTDLEYDSWIERINKKFRSDIKDGLEPLFATDANSIWDIYLNSFNDAGERQYHNCHACRQFIQRYGNLATVDDDGLISSALWNESDAPEAYKAAVSAMAKAVRRAKITGPFFSSERVWGTPVTGEWHHYAIAAPSSIVFKKSIMTAGQTMAEKREDYKNIKRALQEFSQSTINTALSILKAEALYRSEKVLGPIQWLSDLHQAMDSAKNRDNLLWRAVAVAPSGFLHPRSSMAGTLLEDIAAGIGFNEVSRRFKEKMHPLQYQRPQAAPSAGSIAKAEKIMEELGAEGSLQRRFARVDEVKAVWLPKHRPEEKKSGLFSHLKTKDEAEKSSLQIPAQVMTWEKFSRDIMPTAERIQYLTKRSDSYTSFVTATNQDAPPIIQWDTLEKRNPVSWYFYHGGATSSSYSLDAGKFCDVLAISLKPSMWDGANEHQGKGVAFLIDGARDQREPTACLFPEILKAEFREIRSVIEAYSNSAKIEEIDGDVAAGVMLSSGDSWSSTLRVWVSGKCMDYMLDRWE